MPKIAGVLFARPPVQGEVKTRLARYLGAETALKIYLAMLRHQADLFHILKSLERKTSMHVYMAIPPGMSYWQSRRLLRQVIPMSVKYRRQGAGGLGERMITCFGELLRRHEQVIIWGGDIPALEQPHLLAAVQAYPKNCLVPTCDGGYALISVTRDNFHPDMMKHIAWSTRLVLRQQTENFERLGLHYVLTETIPDVDEPDDLLRTLLYLKRIGSLRGLRFAREIASLCAGQLENQKTSEKINP